MQSKGWQTIRDPAVFRTVHSLPIDDLWEHELEDCGCSPKTIPVPHGNGSMGWLVEHHSLDGRELRE